MDTHGLEIPSGSNAARGYAWRVQCRSTGNAFASVAGGKQVLMLLQVQSELHKSLQDQHTLLQHHFQPHAAPQPMPLHGLAFQA